MSEFSFQVVPEETIFIGLRDSGNLKIKGLLRGSLQGPLVVMMHGRCGKANSLIQYLGARYLYERGLSSLRLAMYDTAPDTRNLVDCTLQTHADDFDTVIEYLRVQGSGPIFAEGHSYGGATILRSRAKLDGAVLWDPTHGSYWAEGRDRQDAAQFPEKVLDNLVVGLSGNGYVYPQAIADYDRQVGDTTGWAAGKGYPLKVIAAGNGSMADLGEKYIAVADEPKQFVAINGAGHNFDDSDEVLMELFNETETWFRGILNG